MAQPLISRYTKEELEEIVKNSTTYRDIICRLGYSCSSGSNHKTLKKYLELYNISTSHLTHKPNIIRNIIREEIFCENSLVSQKKLIATIKAENLLPYKCAICGLEPMWNDKPLVLTLDHINGIHNDNREDNIRWVCPNCDRQLDTFGMKNAKKLKKNQQIIARAQTEINPCTLPTYLPDRDILKQYLRNIQNFSQIAKIYNVSDNMVRKWCKKLNLPYHTSVIRNLTEQGWETEKWDDFIPKYIPQPIILHKCAMIDIKTGQIIKVFPSYSAAAKYIRPDGAPNGVVGRIGQVCSGKRETAYGYKWQNITENN